MDFLQLTKPYLIGVGCVFAASIVRIVLTPYLGESAPFLTFFLAVIVASWFAGFRGGATASLLSACAALRISYGEDFVTHLDSLSERSSVVVFIAESLLISALGQTLLSSSRRMRDDAKRIEESTSLMRQNEARNTAILNVALDGIVCIDCAGRIIEFNSAAEAIFGYSASEVIGQGIADLIIPPELRDAHRAGFERYLKTGEGPVLNKRIEITAMRRDGSVFPVELAIMPIAEAGPLQFAAYVRDISIAKQQTADLQRMAEREALLNKIGDVVRSSADPLIMQNQAVEMLGAALGADRCYFATFDEQNCQMVIGTDWHRADLPSLEGVHRVPGISDVMRDLHSSDKLSIMRDCYSDGLAERTVQLLEAKRIRARVSVALAEGTLRTVLSAAMADSARDWSTDDIELIERVASLLRSAVELARIQVREHRIATDLQAALVPIAPKRLPKLSIGTSMRPAMDEAEIGGDFFDVFEIDKDDYAIVIGDVSGKGLAAAAQLALVRNSLRTCLYLWPTAAQAVTALNSILASRRLLDGFVTLFVGIFRPSTCTLTYVSGGHETALIYRRATAAVEETVSTGMPLGVVESSEFSEQSVTLEYGDLLLLYTDGISEAGPTRTNNLGTNGVADMLQFIDKDIDPDTMAATIIDKATVFAGGFLRDDACVVLARCEPAINALPSVSSDRDAALPYGIRGS